MPGGPPKHLLRTILLASQYGPQTGDSTSEKLAAESRKKPDNVVAASQGTPFRASATEAAAWAGNGSR